MPPVAAAVAAAAAKISVAQLAAGLVVSFAVNTVVGALTPKPKSRPAFVDSARGRTEMVRQPITSRRTVYGRTMVSGPVVYMETYGQGGGPADEYLSLVVVLAGHEIDAVEELWLGEVQAPYDASGAVTSGRYAGYAWVWPHLGAADQAADAELVARSASRWTAAHRGRGIAYLHVKFRYSPDVFPQGVPKIRALVRGKKLYDPRTGSTAWSRNAALVCRDHLTSKLGAAAAEIDDATVQAAANVCDETVTLAAGGTEPRYAADGTVDDDRDWREAVEEMLSAMAGTLVWTGGRFEIHAGAASAPVATLTEADRRGPIVTTPRLPRAELYNAVHPVYVEPSRDWQPIDAPPITNATYEAQDGGQRIRKNAEYPFTTSSAAAQRLAKIELERARQQIRVAFPAMPKWLRLKVWDVVAITDARHGWVGKEFRVTGWTLRPDGGVDLALREEAASMWAWSAEETAIDPAPDTGLPDPWTVVEPGVPQVAESLYQTRDGAGVKAKAVLTWTASPTASARYEVDYRPTSSSDRTELPRAPGTRREILDLAPGTYEFRVRAVNPLGATSAWVATTAEIYGLLAPPAQVTGLGLAAIGGMALLSWDRHPDLDVRIGGRIRFRHSPLMSGASWQGATTIGEAAPGGATQWALPLKAGTYLAKAVDSSGVASTAPATIPTKAAAVLAFANLSTVAEASTFAGAHAGTAAPDGLLKLAGTDLVDAIADVDAVADWDSAGGVAASGTYDFAAGIDFGSVKRARLTATVSAIVVNVLDRIDDRSNPIDQWDDLDGTAGADADARVEVRETDDDPAGSPTWSAWRRLDSAEVEARGLDFRAVLTTADPAYNIHLDTLTVDAEEAL